MKVLSLSLLLVIAIVICACSLFDDASPTNPGRAPADTLGLVKPDSTLDSAKDTTKLDTAKVDTTKTDTVKTDTTKKDTATKASGVLTGTRDTVKFMQPGKTGTTTITYVQLDAIGDGTYNLQLFPRHVGTMRVIAARPDSTPQATDPLVGDSVVFPCTRGGTYLVRITAPAGTALRLQMYRSAQLPMYWVGPDSYEYDGDTAHASTINSVSGSQSHTSDYGGRYDVDWVRLAVDSGRTYQIGFDGTSSMLPSLGRPSGFLYDAHLQSLPLLGPEGKVTFASFRKQTCYLKLVGNSNGSVSYSLSVTSTAGLPARALAPDSYEPDDNTPTVLVVDTTGQAHTIHGDSLSGDIDGFLIAADSGVTYKLRFDSKKPLDVTMTSETGIVQTVGLTKDSAGYRIWSLPCVKTGRYLVAVSGPQATAYRIRLAMDNGLPTWTPPPDPWELDNTRNRAINIPLGSKSFARNLPLHDVDWFLVEADSGTQFTWELANGSKTSSWPTLAMEVELFTPDSVLKTSWVVAPQANGASSKYFVGHEKVLLRVRASLLDTTNVIPYVLTTKLGPGTDPYEPDEGVAPPWVMPVDSQVRTRSLPPEDIDWLKLKVQAGNILRLRLGTVGTSRGSVVWKFYGLDGQEATTGPTQGSCSGTTACGPDLPAPRDTTILVKLWGAEVDYTVQAFAVPDGSDAMEPDESMDQARPIATDGAWVSRDVRDGDRDWMTFEVKAGNVYTLEVKGEGNLTGRLWGIDDIALTYLSLPTNYVYRARADGFLKIMLESTRSDIIQPYRLRVTGVPYPDRFEPDESLAAAALLPMDSTLTNRASMPGDDDWMRLVPTPGKYRFLKISTSARDFSVFEIRKPDGSLVKSYNVYDSATLYVGGPQDTGTYYLHLAPKSYLPLATYSVRGCAFADPDTLEPYDTPLAAAWLGAAGITRTFTPNDSDYFRVSLAAGQAAIVSADVPVRIVEYASDGSFLGYLSNGLLRADQKAEIVLKVYPVTPPVGITKYTLQLAPIAFDTSARHATVATAIPVPAGANAFSVLNAYQVPVYLKLLLDPQTLYSLRVKAPANTIEELGRNLVSIAKGKDSLVVANLMRSDSFVYLRIPASNEAGSPGLLTTSVEFRPVPGDAFEPDGDSTHTTLLTRDSVQSHTLVAHDTDWFCIPEQNGDTALVTLVPKGSSIDVEAHDWKRRHLTSSFASPASPQQPWKIAFPPGTGKIYIRVAAWSPDSRIAFPYTIVWSKT